MLKDLYLLIKISTLNGYAISLEELSNLFQMEYTSLIQKLNSLKNFLTIKDGLVVIKGHEKLFKEKNFRFKNSLLYIKNTKIFVKELLKRDKNILFISVCGSTAYRSAKASDDIDIFLIAKKGRLWITLLKAFFMARVYRLKGKIKGINLPFCFSYVMDEEEFEKEFSSNTSFFFAREALTLDILYGHEFYLKKIKENKAILKLLNKVKPRIYNIKLEDEGKDIFSSKFLNKLIFFLLGKYVKLKAIIKNLKYPSFSVITKEGKLLLESDKYKFLRSFYSKLEVF
ncbi:hypothetical protein HRbin06_00767 [archaeon HR06]|nr:hypothetical protein HRbin06_00767 [archaeon HR06]